MSDGERPEPLVLAFTSPGYTPFEIPLDAPCPTCEGRGDALGHDPRCSGSEGHAAVEFCNTHCPVPFPCIDCDGLGMRVTDAGAAILGLASRYLGAR